MRKQQGYYWVPDVISLVMLLTLRLPIDPRYIADAEGSTLFMMLIAAFASLTGITRPPVRLVARWLSLLVALMYLDALEAYGRDLELPLQVIYLIVQVFIPRLPVMERPDDSVISPKTVMASPTHAAQSPAQGAALSKNDQWRQSLYQPERTVKRWMLHLPKVHLPPVTLALIMLNMVVFWSGWQNVPDSGRVLDIRPLRELYPLAADRIALDDPAQWWRLVSAGAFHFSIAHLAGNMLMLYWLGRFLEPTLGSVRFAVYAVAGSVFAVVMGVLALRVGDTVAGASGGVYALIGAYATVLVIHYRLLDVDGKSRWAGLVVLLGYMLYTTVMAGRYSTVSHAGHMGGLVAGVILTLIGGPYFVAVPDPDNPPELRVYDRLNWRYWFRRGPQKPADVLIRR